MKTLRKHLSTMAVAAATTLLVAGAPAMADAIASFARNADKVDGKHAVGAGAPLAKRKGKLVATSPRTGRLPNGIIAKAPNAARLDGKPASRFALKGTLASPGSVNQAGNPVHWGKLIGVPTAFADEADNSGPAGYAHVAGNGTLLPESGGIVTANVVVGTSAGIYCFDLTRSPTHIQVTPDFNAGPAAKNSTARAFGSIDRDTITANCPSDGFDAMVIFHVPGSTTPQPTPFFVSFL